MKILVYGAGPLGSLFAARLCEAGHEVSLLARGQRLDDLKKHGVVLVDTQTQQETVAHPRIVERLDPGDAYDLVLVIMRKNRALEILPALANNRHTPNILFLMNNAAGPGELVKALGQERVLMGFPMAAGYRREHVVYYLVGTKPGKKVMIPIGEVDGRITPRLQEVGRVLASMPGFDVDLRTDMDAWLKTHVALLMPSIAPAMRAAGRDNIRMAHTRDAIVLAIRAIQEGFRVLRTLGYPIVPESVRIFERLPEPILVWGFRKRLMDPRIRVAMFEHAQAAQDEIKYLADEFIALKHQTSIPTPSIDHLAIYFDPAVDPMPEGSAWYPLNWRFLWPVTGILAGLVVIFSLILFVLRSRVVKGVASMPQLVKGGKWVFGWSVVGPNGEAPIPPAAFDEYGFQPGERVIFLRGSKRSGGAGVARPASLTSSRVPLFKRAFGESVIDKNRRVVFPPRAAFQEGEHLLVVRGSGLALGFLQRGPIYEEALRHPEIEVFSV